VHAETTARELVPPLDGSELALSLLRLEAGDGQSLGPADADTLLYVTAGSGTVALGGDRASLAAGTATLVLAGEQATIEAEGGLSALRVTVGPGADRHAPLGPRETTARLADAGAEEATGARSFQVLFGPQNGSTRATLFAGYIPPGKAPWHYHLYDEIVWVPEGPGRLHRRTGGVEELDPGSAFRLRPREVHIVENSSPDREMTILGVFTPAGSPSAAYLSPEVAAAYVFAG
jgi:quercetin dioxygenase-like cupin family protein